VAYSPNGCRIVSGSSDRTVRVWDAARGAELGCLRGHAGWVLSVAYSPDGRRIVSGSIDDAVRVWDADSGQSLEVTQGSGDIAAIAAGGRAFPWRAINRNRASIYLQMPKVRGRAFPWRAINRNLGTVFEPAGRGEAVAWFPAAMDHITTHASERVWAGSADNHLYLIRLEGEPDSKPREELREE
jgi:hypothetical protein